MYCKRHDSQEKQVPATKKNEYSGQTIKSI